MGRQSFSRRALLSMSKVVEKEREGFFEKGRFNVIKTSKGGFKDYEFGFYNNSDQTIHGGNLVYVIGANMPAYAYEEACYYIENKEVCVSVRHRSNTDKDEDLVVSNSHIEAWQVNDWVFVLDMFFATVMLSDSFNGSDEYYYAKPYTPPENNNIQWIYYPTFITTKKDDATHRIFDGSNLPWRYIYPEYYSARKNKYADEEVPPRVVMALLRKLPNPTLPSGRYLATVASDVTIDDSKNINIVIENGANTYKEKAISPLSSVGDKFREGQKVIVQPIDNMNSLFVIINAEC